jgi:flagellar biosynthetic protein FlhB
MSQERREKATPKKREDARKKGQIARGAELPAALAFLGALIAFKISAGEVVGRLLALMDATAGRIVDPKAFTEGDIHNLMIDSSKVLAIFIAPVIAVAFVAVIAGNFAQGGVNFSTEALMPKAEKFNPVQNAKRVFGLDSVVNLTKSLIKLLFIGTVAYGVLAPVIESAPSLVNAPLATFASSLGETLYSLAFRCGIVLLVLALADYGYAYYKHEKSLRMSMQEIRDEYKDQEGDPMVKSQRRRAARELTQRRSMAEIPSASVVITNPTHFAVALRYDRDKDAAPIVVAKGADLLAAKIRQIATENDVPLVENPPLARALFKLVEPNQIIPAEFFGPVAEILAYVFRRKTEAR